METAENNRLRKSRNLEDQLDVTIGQNTSNPVVILIPVSYTHLDVYKRQS